MIILAGSSNKDLAINLSKLLGLKFFETQIDTFPNGEKRVRVDEAVRGENIVLVQSLSRPVDEYLIETLLIADALERQGAKHVNLVIPWLGYSLQDKIFTPGEPISAKVVASLLSHAYVKRIYLLEVHNTSIAGFFSVPTHHLSATSLYLDYVKHNFDLSQAVVASPDFGGLKRARSFADQLGLGLANIDKQRDLDTGKVSVNALQGEVKEKIVLMLDDVIVSGSTAIETARLIKEEGAKEVHFLSTHGIFANDSLQKLTDSQLDSIVITNSIFHKDLPKKIQILDISPLLSESLRIWIN